MNEIRVIGGPWPERIGCTGRIVDDELDPKIYPRHGRGPGEVIVLLDDDPLNSWHGDDDQTRGWSCVYDRADVEPIGPPDG